MSKAKSAHYCKIITEHSDDYGSLWKAFNKILHRCPKTHLPDHSSIATLANTFSSFFVNKISVIRSSFPSDSHSRVRSNNDNSLSVPRVKTNTGARAFHPCAPSLWNNLPLSVHSASSVANFKKYMKTHLFDLAFPP